MKDQLTSNTSAQGASAAPAAPMQRIELATEEAAGNSDPLNRTYFLNGGRIGRGDGAVILSEMRRNGTFRDVTDGQHGGGVWRFYYVGQVPESMVTAARAQKGGAR